MSPCHRLSICHASLSALISRCGSHLLCCSHGSSICLQMLSTHASNGMHSFRLSHLLHFITIKLVHNQKNMPCRSQSATGSLWQRMLPSKATFPMMTGRTYCKKALYAMCRSGQETAELAKNEALAWFTLYFTHVFHSNTRACIICLCATTILESAYCAQYKQDALRPCTYL